MAKIKLIISDFDGTLVDTFQANYMAYQKAFSEYNLNLDEEDYKKCYGMRFDDFMNALQINDKELRKNIREFKKEYYPRFFTYLRVNNFLLNLMIKFKESGNYTAIASTARKENLINVLDYLNIKECFSFIKTGEDVKIGKPNPEIYDSIVEHFNVQKEEVLIFEDSIIGIQAAQNAEISYIKIDKQYFK